MPNGDDNGNNNWRRINIELGGDYYGYVSSLENWLDNFSGWLRGYADYEDKTLNAYNLGISQVSKEERNHMSITVTGPFNHNVALCHFADSEHRNCLDHTNDEGSRKKVCPHCGLCAVARENNYLQHYRCYEEEGVERTCSDWHCTNDPEHKQCEACGKCPKYCHCESCTGACGRKCADLCTAKHCKDDCKCADYCWNCRAISSGRCGDCRNCENCCSCPKFQFTQIPRTPKFLKSPNYKYNKSQRMVSAEIEVCGLKKRSKLETNEVIKRYGGVIRGDGSLPSTGFEINTAPANGDTFVDQVLEICKGLENQGGWVDCSAGLHVHVDHRDASYEDLQKLAILYGTLEPAIIQLVDQTRLDSTYCKPNGAYFLYAFKNADLTGPNAANKFRDIIGTYNDRFCYNGERYCALNYHAFSRHKTVECRLHQGTIKAHEIARWGLMWVDIADFAKESNLNNIKGMIGKSPKELLLNVVRLNSIKNWIAKEVDDNVEAIAI